MKYFSWSVVFLLLGLLSLGGRAWWGAETELNLARKDLGNGFNRSAIIHYEKAILWRVPFGGYREEAVREIERLGHDQDPVVQAYARDALAFSSACTDRKKDRGTGELPDPFWSPIVGLSLLGWIGMTFPLISSGFSPELRLRRKAFVRSLVLFSVLFGLWICAIMRL